MVISFISERATVAFEYASLAGNDQLAPVMRDFAGGGRLSGRASAVETQFDSFAEELSVAAEAVATKLEAAKALRFSCENKLCGSAGLIH